MDGEEIALVSKDTEERTAPLRWHGLCCQPGGAAALITARSAAAKHATAASSRYKHRAGHTTLPGFQGLR